jgi:hypothetical protein
MRSSLGRDRRIRRRTLGMGRPFGQADPFSAASGKSCPFRVPLVRTLSQKLAIRKTGSLPELRHTEWRLNKAPKAAQSAGYCRWGCVPRRPLSRGRQVGPHLRGGRSRRAARRSAPTMLIHRTVRFQVPWERRPPCRSTNHFCPITRSKTGLPMPLRVLRRTTVPPTARIWQSEKRHQ